jgi:hypothetical protein
MILKFFAARFQEKVSRRMTPMETTTRISEYIIRSAAAAVLLLTAQISLAGSATWLSSPQDSTWENPNNWTAGGPPNGPSDFTSNSNSFTLNISPSAPGVGGRTDF